MYPQGNIEQLCLRKEITWEDKKIRNTKHFHYFIIHNTCCMVYRRTEFSIFCLFLFLFFFQDTLYYILTLSSVEMVLKQADISFYGFYQTSSCLTASFIAYYQCWICIVTHSNSKQYLLQNSVFLHLHFLILSLVLISPLDDTVLLLLIWSFRPQC